MSIFWIITLVACVLLEAATMTLVSIWFAAGALGALLASVLGAGIPVQVAVFIAISVLCIAFTRPLLKKLMPKYIPTNGELDIGKNAIVTEKIDPVAGTGRVRIDDVFWGAKSAQGTVIEEGVTVVVTGKGAATVTVEEIR